jgi:serine/threonine protein kinase
MENIISDIYKNKVIVTKNLGKFKNIFIFEGLLIKSELDNKKVMIKVIQRSNSSNFKNILMEVGFLKYLSKYVSSKKYIHLCYNAKLTKEFLIIVQETPTGITLTEFIKEIMKKTFEDYNRIVLVIMYKLLLAINYIHSKSVSHRGLNPDDIYINYDPVNNLITDLKINNFVLSCGKYDELTEFQNNNINNKTKKKNNNNINNSINSKYKFCDVIDISINPPERFNIDSLVKQIQSLINNQTRESTYLYLAKKLDVWTLGVLFWKLLNRKDIKQNPLSLVFPSNYQKNKSWKTFNGYQDVNPLMSKIFQVVVEKMLVEIPFRGKSNEILEEFIVINKYYDDYDEDLAEKT